MSQVIFNIRMDDKLKNDFSELCEKLGLNMSVAMNMFARKAVLEQRIPFDVSLDIDDYNKIIERRIEELAVQDRIIRQKGYEAFSNLKKQVIENGLDKMSFEELNKEILETRKSLKWTI